MFWNAFSEASSYAISFGFPPCGVSTSVIVVAIPLTSESARTRPKPMPATDSLVRLLFISPRFLAAWARASAPRAPWRGGEGLGAGGGRHHTGGGAGTQEGGGAAGTG